MQPVNFKEIAFPYHGVELPAFKVSIPEFYFGSFALTATVRSYILTLFLGLYFIT
jgi:hypothetical protein